MKALPRNRDERKRFVKDIFLWACHEHEATSRDKQTIFILKKLHTARESSTLHRLPLHIIILRKAHKKDISPFSSLKFLNLCLLVCLSAFY